MVTQRVQAEDLLTDMGASGICLRVFADARRAMMGGSMWWIQRV